MKYKRRISGLVYLISFLSYNYKVIKIGGII